MASLVIIGSKYLEIKENKFKKKDGKNKKTYRKPKTDIITTYLELKDEIDNQHTTFLYVKNQDNSRWTV